MFRSFLTFQYTIHVTGIVYPTTNVNFTTGLMENSSRRDVVTALPGGVLFCCCCTVNQIRVKCELCTVSSVLLVHPHAPRINTDRTGHGSSQLWQGFRLLVNSGGWIRNFQHIIWGGAWGSRRILSYSSTYGGWLWLVDISADIIPDIV